MISVVFDDIFLQPVEALVNPANSYMLHGGGLAAQIVRRGGPEVLKTSQGHVIDHGPVPTGEAITTPAGKLPQKAIIHVVGPVWDSDAAEPYWRQNSSEEDPDELLAQAHRSIIREAQQHEIASVALPAVSCGVFRFPAERAAPIAITAVCEALKDSDIKVIFCVLDDEHHEAFESALEDFGAALGR